MAYLGPSPHPEHVPPVHGVLKGGAEASIGPADLQHGLLHLVHLGLGQPLDVAQLLFGHHLDALHCADSSSLQLLNVGNINPMVLKELNVL